MKKPPIANRQSAIGNSRWLLHYQTLPAPGKLPFSSWHQAPAPFKSLRAACDFAANLAPDSIILITIAAAEAIPERSPQDRSPRPD